MNHVYLGDKDKVYLCEYQYDINAKSLIIIPSLGWYHVGPNRIYAQIGELCNKKGINVFCFDYIGTGESTGTYELSSYDYMIIAFNYVYNYVLNKYNNNIYVLGYGAGNIVLKDIDSKINLMGSIYYLPRFDDILKYKNSVGLDEESKKDGYYFVKVACKENNFIFWRGILGEIHDCTYNPITYELVDELCIKLKESINKNSLAKNKLLILDDKRDKYECDVIYTPEFKENILPDDWYKTINLWPDTLYVTHCKIIDWIENCKNETNSDLKLNDIHTSYEMTTEKGIRKILSFNSGDKKLFGILNCPKEIKKKAPCVIFLPGLGGDKVDNFTCGPRLGDYASENGIVLFRYDNRYSGATATQLTDFTWTGVIGDFLNALKALKKYENIIDLNSIILVSWSNGAKLSSYITSHKLCNVKLCCFWNPVFIDSNISQKLSDKKNMRKNMTRYKKNKQGQLATQIGGEYLGMQYNIDNKKYDFKTEFSKIDVPRKFIWGIHDIDSAEYKYINALEDNVMNENFTIESDHHLFSYESLGVVIRKTIELIKKSIV